tara:strand:+ start:215 stop:472 length:258 start_codon:yes stop_codon:yes gene_type:complete
MRVLQWDHVNVLGVVLGCQTGTLRDVEGHYSAHSVDLLGKRDQKTEELKGIKLVRGPPITKPSNSSTSQLIKFPILTVFPSAPPT